MRAQEFITEAFDQPYPVEFEHSEYGDVDALATLDDGTPLSIMFNQESGHDGRRPSHWSVEFYRNNSQEVTGEGDAQKVFATVIEAIRQFVIKMKPGSISFSASKEPEVDIAKPGANVNPESRAKLYNRLVQRYAESMGYGVQQQEGNGKVTYTLRQVKQGVAEGARVARKAGQPADSKKHSDLYTDENPRGTITGLKFATAADARASVSKIRSSGRSHAHKIQAAVAMEQRARAAGKAEAAAVYRRYINANKKSATVAGSKK